MQQLRHPPLSGHLRFRAHTAAAFAGAVALPLSAFFLPNSVSALPYGIGVLLLVSALSAAAAFAAASGSKARVTSSSNVMQLVRCGARGAVLAAMLAAAMTVLGTRLFGSQSLALTAFFPCALSILPAAFIGVIAAAVAAGVRLPRLPQTPSSKTPTGRGAVMLFLLASAAGFLSALYP